MNKLSFENTGLNKIELNGLSLKLIAMITMLIDHITVTLKSYNVLQDSSMAYLVGRSIGRMAFPLFCFLLVEGFFNTRNIKRYLLRLVIFAFLSEIPFNLFIAKRIFYFNHQNIFFTLTVGLLLLMYMKKVEETFESKSMQFILNAIIVIAACMLSILLLTDYSYMGILMILVFYLFRKNKLLLAVTLFLVNNTGDIQALAVLSMIPIMFYNGQRGPQRNKYVFYAFYPVHLLMLYLVGQLIL